jgi:hypothetical protein
MDKLARALGKAFVHRDLPAFRPHPIRSGPGTGAFCDVCHEVIGERDRQYEFSSPLAPGPLRTHLACYEAWQDQSIEHVQCVQQNLKVRGASRRACLEFLRCDLRLGHALLDCAEAAGQRERMMQLQRRAGAICDAVEHSVAYASGPPEDQLSALLAALRHRLVLARRRH